MKKLVLTFILAVLCFIVGSCDHHDGSNFHFTALKAIRAEVPESFALNETYNIKVTYERPDNCTFFEGFDVTRQDITARNVVVVGSVITDISCTDQIEEVVVAFNFIVLYDQTYTFRFWEGKDENGVNQFFEVTVPVN